VKDNLPLRTSSLHRAHSTAAQPVKSVVFSAKDHAEHPCS